MDREALRDFSLVRMTVYGGLQPQVAGEYRPPLLDDTSLGGNLLQEV
jgi:hypothetical protein